MTVEMSFASVGSMWKLVEGPDHPEHVDVDRDGLAFTTIEQREEMVPARFTGVARPGDVPWATLLFGLETGRFDLRKRFLDALRDDARAGHELDEYGRVLAAAFHSIFGGRGPTAETPGFEAFVREALEVETEEAVRAQLERGLVEREAVRVDEVLAAYGAQSVVFGAETGHVPADHAAVLYWMSALVPDWNTVVFEQDADDEVVVRLHAWWAGQHVTAAVDDRGDFVDAWSCAALINTMLRDIARVDTRVYLEVVDESVRAIGAPRSVLRKLRDAAVIV